MVEISFKKIDHTRTRILTDNEKNENKTNNLEIIFNSYYFEVELFKTDALHRQMVLRVYKNEKLHHIIVNMLDTMVVPFIFYISLAQSVRIFGISIHKKNCIFTKHNIPH